MVTRGLECRRNRECEYVIKGKLNWWNFCPYHMSLAHFRMKSPRWKQHEHIRNKIATKRIERDNYLPRLQTKEHLGKNEEYKKTLGDTREPSPVRETESHEEKETPRTNESPKTKNKKRKRYKKVYICTVDSKYDIVRRVASRFGMKEVSENEPWNLFWTDISVTVERAKEMKRFQRINHFPGMSEICRKDLLAKNLNRMAKLFPKDYNFFPKTWCIPSDLGEVLAFARNKRAQTYICKPDSGCQGRGIYITRNVKDLKLDDRMICQVYITKPFLIDGYKFDLRIYSLITSCDPLRIYVYNDGLIRLATIRYREPNENNRHNMFMHLTNYAVNRHNRSCYKITAEDGEEGSKRRLEHLGNWLKDKGVDIPALWAEIDQVIVKTVISAQPILKHSYHACFPTHDIALACFELLGFDILLDHRLKPYVLEVNHSPSFHTDAPIDLEVKEPLLMDTFRILNLTHADRTKVLLEDKRRIRDRLLQGLKAAEENNSRTQTPATKYKKMLETQANWEDKHLGNFRLIYPAENAADYEPFFNQNVGSLYQDTAASKAREECARQLRESRRERVLKEVTKKTNVFVRKRTHIRRVYSSNRFSVNGIQKKFCFEPEPIDKLEEAARKADLANREALLRHVDLPGFLYRSLRRNGALSDRDRRVYGEEGPLPPAHTSKIEMDIPKNIRKYKQLNCRKTKKFQIAKLTMRTLPLSLDKTFTCCNAPIVKRTI